MKEITNGSLYKASVAYIISNILIKAISFLTMPLFTGLLTVEENGRYITYMSYEGILSIIIACGLVYAIRSARFDFDDLIYEKFKNSIVDLEFFFLILLVAFSIIFNSIITSLLGYSNRLLFILIFNSFGSALITLFTQIYQMEYKIKKIVFLSLFVTIGSIVISYFLIVFLLYDNKDFARILGSAIPAVIFAIIICAKNLLKKEKVVDYSFWKYSLSISLIALPQILAENLLSQSDRIMIERILGVYEAGVYGTINTYANILSIIIAAISSAVVPWIYNKIQNGKSNEVNKFYDIYVILTGAMAVGFVMISPELIRFFAPRPDYWGKHKLLIIFAMVNYLKFIPVIISNIFFFYKKGVYAVIGVCIGCGINIVLNAIFIPMCGYEIAAITSLIATVLNLIYILIVLKMRRYNYIKLKSFLLKLSFVLFYLIINIFISCNTILRYSLDILFVLFILLVLANNNEVKEVIRSKFFKK